MPQELIDHPLSPVEKAHVAFVQRTLVRGKLDDAMRWCQRHIGARWINHSTRNLLHVRGLERLPTLDPRESYVLASNHRSFFDLYVVSAFLVGRGLPHRLLFPVRANFFYDHPAGFLVNGVMSFFAMYPPVFRDRARQATNIASLDEVVRVLRGGGAFVGLHPEGTRNKGSDPYTLLPAQSGIGRIVHRARVKVLPVFVNGLSDSIPRQVVTNATRHGTPITLVFGEPVDFGSGEEDLLAQAPSPRAYRAVAERVRAAIVELGREERAFRATVEERPGGPGATTRPTGSTRAASASNGSLHRVEGARDLFVVRGDRELETAPNLG
jgi:1-acyl-sn-glycerol-3-phosphate acyltransferase